MKQAIVRKILTGGWTAFRFPERGRKYYVKNFGEGDIYVSFVNDGVEATAFKIKGYMGEELQMGFASKAYPYGLVDVIYVKGTGEVEVQSEEILVENDWEPEE